MQATQKPLLHQDWIDPDAFKIVKTLQSKGFKTYLVGGCVRDLLLGIHPKDYDIATDAKPQEIRRLIPMSFIIGKRFRLVLVKRGDRQYEVATFRRDGVIAPTEEEGFDPKTSDNIFGTPEEDARRRDFTINGLFYDPVNDELIDYVNGIADLKAGIVRMIGDPVTRFNEDPIRIFRALRLCHLIGFKLEENMREAMKSQADTLKGSALPRRREEFLKILRLDNPVPALLQGYDLGMWAAIAPILNETFARTTPDSEWMLRLSRTDEIFLEESPLEILAHFINHWVRSHIEGDSRIPIKAHALMEDPRLVALMKDELGVFRHEQDSICRAIQLQHHLINLSGEGLTKRQMAILVNETFPLALILAETDHLLTQNETLRWVDGYLKSAQTITDVQTQRKKRKRRRRRKGPGDRAPVGATTNDEESDEDGPDDTEIDLRPNIS